MARPVVNRLVEIAKLGVSLRWRLSNNRLRRRGKRTRRFTLIASLAYTAFNIVILGAARFASDADAARTLTLLMASMALGWVFGPVLIGGVDETIDPTKLALLPLSWSERYVVQLAAAVSGAGPIAASVGLVIGLSIGHIRLGLSLVVVPIAALCAILLMVGAARALAGALAIALRSRAGRDAAVLAAAIVGGSLFTMAQLARDVGARADTLIDAMGWIPLAWPARAINAARRGDDLVSLGWLGASLVLMVALHGAWIWLSNFLLLNGERSAQSRRRTNRSTLSGASSRFGASLARQWIYLRRSPNNRVGFVYGTVFGIAFALVQIVQQGDGSGAAAAFGILLAMLANMGATTNVLGFDAGSLWMEVLADGPGRVHIVARQLVAMPNLLLPTWISGIVVGLWTGEWTLVLLVSLLAIPIAVNVLTFGIVTSAIAPAALPDWDNPFGNRQSNEGRGLRLAAIAIVGIGVILVLSAPIFVLLFSVYESWLAWLVPIAGLAYAAIPFGLATLWVGRYLRGREPHLIATLAPRAMN
jgi:ABC-2 type transport system permease protein